MVLTGSHGRSAGLLVVFGLGSGLLSLHLFHAISTGKESWALLVGILVPMGLSVALLAGGGWLWRSDLSGSHVLRIGGWCLVGSAVLAIGAGLVFLYQRAEGVLMQDWLFVLANAAAGGGVVGFVVGTYDVRQQTARADAEQLNQRLTVLNRVLRHDIRNHSNVIHGRADLLSTGEQIGAQIETIQRHATELVELGDHAKVVERLLDEGHTKRENTDINPVLKAELERIERDYPGVEVEASIPDGQRVYAHPLVGSAIASVLDNAVEHNDKERPRVEIECTRLSEDETEYVEVRITDNGPGIPDEQTAILERGYETQLEHTNGLGLWIVRWIVVESAGDVTFEEASPEGTTVRMRFEAAGNRPPDTETAGTTSV